MKRTLHFFFSALVVAGMTAAFVAAQSQPQSLADAARKARQEKSGEKPKYVFDDDSLPRTDTMSDKVAPAGANAAKPDAAATATTADASKGKAAAAAKPDDKKDTQKLEEQWRSKIAEQKKKIDTTAKELDLLQREHKLQAAAFYADAGTRLRDDRNWADKERQFKDDETSKQQQLADLKQQLEDMREAGRKAGISAAALE